MKEKLIKKEIIVEELKTQNQGFQLEMEESYKKRDLRKQYNAQLTQNSLFKDQINREKQNLTKTTNKLLDFDFQVNNICVIKCDLEEKQSQNQSANKELAELVTNNDSIANYILVRQTNKEEIKAIIKQHGIQTLAKDAPTIQQYNELVEKFKAKQRELVSVRLNNKSLKNRNTLLKKCLTTEQTTRSEYYQEKNLDEAMAEYSPNPIADRLAELEEAKKLIAHASQLFHKTQNVANLAINI
jgi:hypothetical protein